MKPRTLSVSRLSLALATALAALLARPSAHAATYYWDQNTAATAGFGAAGGTWNTAGASTWNLDSSGGNAGTPAGIVSTNTTTGDGENFGTATAGLTAGTITVGTVSAGNMTFGAASGAIILNGGSIGFGNSIITVNNATDTINSTLTGGNTLSKAGTGILVLGGTANTRTGKLTISNGTISVSTIKNYGVPGGLGQQASTTVDQLGAGASTGTLIYTGAVDSTNRQFLIGDATAGNAGGTRFINNGTGALTFNATNFNPTITGITATRTLTLGGSSASTNNITISGIIQDNVASTGKVALNIGSTTFGANVTLSGPNTFTGNVSLPAANTQPRAILTLTNSGALGTGTKTITSQGASGTNGGEIHLQNNITLASGLSFTLSGPALWNDSGDNTINGAINFQSGSGNTFITSTSGSLTIAGNMTATAADRGLNLRGNGDGLISGIISNGTTVNLPVLKDSGAGTWTLSGVNTYTGITTVTAGTLRATTSVQALGTGVATLSLGGGTLELANDTGLNFARNTTVTAASTITSDTLTAVAGVTHTLGTLNIGAHTLNITTGANATGTTAGITFGATTLTSSSNSFAPAADTSLTVAAVSGDTFTLNKAGAGRMNVTGLIGTTTGGLAVTAGTLAITSNTSTFTGAVSATGATTVLTGGNATPAGTATGGIFGIASGTVGANIKQITLTNGATFRPSTTWNFQVVTGALPGNGYQLVYGTGGGGLDVPNGVTLTLDDGTTAGGTAAATANYLANSGTTTITRTGTGTLVLSKQTQFTATVNLNAGQTNMTGADSLGNAANAISVASGAALNAGNITMTRAYPLTLAGTGLASAPVGALTASASTFTWVGPITIASGGATIGGGAGALTLSNTATIDTAGNTLTLNQVGVNTLTNGVISGLGNVVVTGSGAGLVVPGAAHTYTGGTSLNSGSLAIGLSSTGSAGSPTDGPFGAGATPLILNGSRLRSGTSGPFTIGNTVTIAADTTFFTNASEKSLIFSGPVTITGADRTITSTVGTTVAGTGAFFNGAIGDGGNNLGLSKAGTGNLTLGGANTYTGVTGATDGNLYVTGSLANNSGLSIVPAAASGTLVSFINSAQNTPANFNSLALGSVTGTTTLGLELGASTATSDSINTSAAAATAGIVNLNIMALAGFGTASSYDLISAASGLVDATYVLTSAPGGYTYSLTPSASLVTLNVTPTTPGDLYWRGNNSNSWSAFTGVNTNWYTDAAGSTNAQANPGAGDTVNFSTTNTFGPVISTTLNNNFTVNDLVFNSSPSGVTAVNVAGGLTPAAIPGVLSIAPTSSADGINVASNAGAVTISAPVLLGTNQTWTVDGTGANGSALTVSGAVTGTGTLDITGLVTLSAPGNSIYSGATTVPSGSILRGGATNSFSSASAVTVNGTGILRLNGFSNTIPSLTGDGIVQNNHASTGATLTVGDVNNTAFSGTLENGAGGTLALAKTGAGILTLSGANTYTGGTTINTGTIQQGVANALPTGAALTVNGTSVFDLNGLNASVSTLGGESTGIVTDDAAGTGTSTLSLTAAAGSSDTKITNGTRTVALRVTNQNGNFRLTNSLNTFSGGIVLTNSTGGTRMSPGVITAGAYGTGAITIGESPTDLAGILFGNATTLTNPLVFNTALGTDRVGIRVDATVTLSGQLTANLAPVTFATNATAATLNATGKITGPDGLVLAPNPYDLATARALTVNLNNTAGTNDYEGDTIVNLNPLLLKNTTLTLLAADQIPNGAGKGNVIVNSNGTGIGQLSLAGFDETINGLSGNGNVVNSLVGTYTLTLGDNNANGNHTGAINNTVGTLIVTKIGSGTQTLASPVGVGGSDFAGALNVNGGLVAFPASPATAGPLGNSTAVTLNGGGLSYTGSTSNALNRTVAIGASAGTFDVASLAGTLTVPGTDVTSTAGNLVKTGPGTLSLSGTTTLNGGLASVVVSAGRLQAGFGSAGIATINVGAAGNLSQQNGIIQNLTLDNSAGALTVAGGARLGFECDAATNDSIAVGATGTPAMGAGVITLDLINFGAGVANGNTYTLLTTTTGDLTNAGATTYALGNAPSGFNYTVNVSSTAVSVTVAAFSPAYWTNSQSSGSWSTLNGVGPFDSNFSTDAAGTLNLAALPGSSETVSLSSTTLAGPTVATVLDGNFTLYGLNFIEGSGTVTTVSVDQGSSGTLTIRPSAVAGGIDVGTNAGNVTIGAPLVASNTNSASQTWNVDGTGANGSSLTLNGVTTFTANVIKTGAGVLTLGNAGNTGAGNFTLTGGTLSISAAGNLPTGVLTIGAGTTINNTSGGTVSLANSAYTWSGDFTQTGQSLDQGSAAVTLGATVQATVVTNTLTVGGAIDDGASTFGITKAGAGTLVLSGTSPYGGVTSVTAGTLNLTGSLTGGGAIATSSTGILSQSSLGVISGASTVTQASSGTSVLSGTNSYSGLTTITGGVLQITNASALGATTAGTTQSGTSALELDGTGGSFIVGAEPLTINGGGVSGSDGALRNIAGDNFYGGTVTMAAQSRINSDAGTLTLDNATSVSGVAQSLLVGGAGNVTISGAIATTTGGVTKDGAGTLTLGGANAYTGNTTVTAGILNITGSIIGNTTTSTLAYGTTAGNTVVNHSGNLTAFITTGANIAGANTVFNQTAGTVTIVPTNGSDTQWVARTGYGALNITGGTFNTGRFDVTAPGGTNGVGVVYVGGTGTYNQNVGDWTILTRTNGTAQLTVGPGGTVTRAAGVSAPFALTMDGTNSSATLNVAGGSVSTGTTRGLQVGFTTPGLGNTSIVNVAGGTLAMGLNMIKAGTAGSTATFFNFAGGTMRSNAAMTEVITPSGTGHTITSTIFGAIDNAGAANDFTGGVTIDTNGFATTYTNAFRAASGTGVTQADIGDLSLLAGNTGYIGAPAVTFSLPLVAGADPASGYALISGGAVTGIVITNPGVYASGEQPTITLTGGGGSIAPFQTSALATNNVSGGLTKIGANTLTLSGANTYSGATLVSAGRLQLNGAAATGVLATSSVTVGAAGTLGFTAAATSTLDLTGKPMTLSGGTLNFDIGASGINDAITVDNFTLTANSAITFNSLGGLSEGANYTLVTSANPITNSGPFTLTGQTIGRVTLTPTINNAGPYTITVTADVDESAWGVDSAGDWSLGTNWTGYLPETAGDAALFGSVITAARTVAVDTPQTVGFIRFNNANAYTIGANGSNLLTLNNGGSNALVTVTSGSHTIAENVLLASNMVALPAASTTLTMSGVVSGVSRNVTMNGAGTLALSGVNTYSGTTTVSDGILTLSGNRTATAGDVTVGNVNGKTGTLNVSNGSFSTGTFVLGTGNGTAVGIVNQSAGTLTLTGGTQLIMGNGGSGGTLAGAGGNGTYNLSGGTLTATASANRGVMLGTNDGGTSTFNLSDMGTLTLTGASVLMVGRSDSPVVNTTNLFNQSGGTATVTNFTIGGAAAAATGLNSTFTVTGGVFSATAFNNLGAGNSGTVAINIGGTGQVTLPAFPTVRGTGTTTTITFDSTTGYLRPTATSAAYMPATTLTTAKLTANGAKIDTNGFDITIGQVLQDDSTLGTLTKSGLGNLTLTGVNTYTGTTTISAGTLTINEGSIADSSNIVNNAALAYALTTNARIYANAITGTGSLTKSGTNTLTLSGTNSYTGATTVSQGTLTISGSTNTTAGNVTVGSATPGSTLNIASGGSLTTTGTLLLGGSTGNILTVQSGASLNIASITNPFGSSYTVDGTLTSTGSWTVSTNRTADTFNGTGTINASALTLGNATTGVNYSGSGTINIAGAVTVASNGASGNPSYTQSSGTLNASSMLLGDNTTNTAGSRTFNLNGGRVNLGSGGIASTGTTAATRAVNLGAGTLGASADWSSSLNMALTSASPGVTINTLDSVDNTTARTITLSGILSGTTFALNKSGAGTLILTNANTYTGDTTINEGTLQIGAAGATGSLSPSSAIVNNANLTFNQTDVVLQGTDFSSAAITGSGSLTQAGTSTLTLNVANSYAGNTTISGANGSISALASGALGNPATSDVIISGGRRLSLGTGVTIANDITVNANSGEGGRGLIEASAGTAILSGAITINAGALAGGHFAGVGAAVLDIQGVITSSVLVQQRLGTVKFSGGGTGYTSMVATGTTIVGAEDGIATTAVVTLGGSGNSTLNLNGYNQSLAGIVRNANTTTIGNSSLTADSVLTTTGTSSYSGTIVDSVLSGTRKVGLIVASGDLTLSGVNTYSGTTSINAGKLSLSGIGTIASTPSITIADTATFDVSAITPATYTITGATPQQTLAASSTSGTAAVNATGKTLALASSAQLSFQAAGGGSSTVGKISVTGDLTLNTNAVTVNVTGSALALGTYTLLDYTGTLTGDANATPTITGTALSAGHTATVVTDSINKQVNLVIKKIPTISGVTASQTITYGTGTITLSGTVSAPGPIYPADGETVSVTINGNTQNATVAGGAGGFTVNYNSSSIPASLTPHTITYSYAGNLTILGAAVNDTSTTLTVNKKALSISPPAIANRPYNGTATAGAVTVGTLSGFVSPETVTVTATAADYSGVNVGTYPGNVVTYSLVDGTNGGLASNYSLANDTATGVIVKADQTITFTPLPASVPKSNGTQALVATASSGLTVGFGSSDSTIASVSGSTLTLHQGGSIMVGASQLGDSNYNAAPSVTQPLIITGYTAVADAATRTTGSANIKIPIAALLANDGAVGSGGSVTPGTGLTLTSVTSGTGNTVTSDATWVYFTPSTPANSDPLTFTYTSSDGTDSATATVTVTTTAAAPFTLSILRVVSAATYDSGFDTTSVTVELAGVPNSTYQIEYSPDLATWSSPVAYPTGATGTFNATFTAAGNQVTAWSSLYFRATR